MPRRSDDRYPAIARVASSVARPRMIVDREIQETAVSPSSFKDSLKIAALATDNRNDSVAITAADGWKIVLPEVLANDGSCYDPVSGEFTVPEDGIYRVYAQAKVTSSTDLPDPLAYDVQQRLVNGENVCLFWRISRTVPLLLITYQGLTSYLAPQDSVGLTLNVMAVMKAGDVATLRFNPGSPPVVPTYWGPSASLYIDRVWSR